MERPQNFENKEDAATIAEFKKLIGEDPDYLLERLIDIWENRGAEDAKRHCINDADKFTGFSKQDQAIIRFLEQNLFQAGKDGLDKKTPWNNLRREEAGLPFLHDFE